MATISTSHIRSYYDFIFRRAAEGILIVNAQHRLFAFNPAAAALLQLNPDSVIGLLPKEAFPSNPLLVRLLRSGEPSPMTLDIPLPGDRIAQGTAEDMPDGARIAVLNDVTEQRNLESRRSEFIRTMAHDLRNPLNALSGYADLVAKFGELNERQQKFITRIKQTSTKLQELTSNLVNLAWFEAGMPLEYFPFDLVSIIRDVVHQKSALAQSKNIRIITSIQDTVPLIMGHPTAIHTALAHLVDNAIQYSAPESVVIIHAWQQQHLVMCSVADRGMGILDDEIDRIWDRLWRSPRVQDRPGGGIGLTYVKTVIERHGGRISVESRPDHGTTFTFSLPFVDST
ncbi:MAG: hypothetical protein CUN55_14155 [Phototrophicales bacterium]|nr:MAG: hypothetical protein CUN55_14155 [Phototrophicales bacterium]